MKAFFQRKRSDPLTAAEWRLYGSGYCIALLIVVAIGFLVPDRYFHFALGLSILGVLAIGGWIAFEFGERDSLVHECPKCHYDRRKMDKRDRCPECGHDPGLPKRPLPRNRL